MRQNCRFGAHPTSTNRNTKGIIMGNPAEWNEMVGQLVQIQHHGRTIRIGYIEGVTEAADALWIAAYGIEGRALYEKAQGHTVLPVTENEGAGRGHQG
jgi:hypothetical protein